MVSKRIREDATLPGVTELVSRAESPMGKEFYSTASSHLTVRCSRLLLCASNSARIVRKAWSGVTSKAVPFSMASRTLA